MNALKAYNTTTNGDTASLIETAVAEALTEIARQIPLIVSETVKATLNGMPEPHNTGVKTVMQPKTEKSYRIEIRYKSKIDDLPTNLKKELIIMLFEKRSTYFAIREMLRTHGHDISISNISRYKQRIQRRFDEVDRIIVDI